jgi:hypothetical protein
MDPVHAGIMIILALNISLMTPPVGACLFVLASVTGERIERDHPALWPFLLAEVAGAAPDRLLGRPDPLRSAPARPVMPPSVNQLERSCHDESPETSFRQPPPPRCSRCPPPPQRSPSGSPISTPKDPFESHSGAMTAVFKSLVETGSGGADRRSSSFPTASSARTTR